MDEVVEIQQPHQSGYKQQFKEYWRLFMAFVKECLRVFRITKKPSNEEFKTIVKVSGIGILVIGLIGFLIHAIKELFF
jgi:protein transport protein SEC61 subunit gamma and related proteins